MAANNFLNCVFNSSKVTIESGGPAVTDTLCQFSWTPPVSEPAWDAANIAFDKSVINAGITAPTSPGNAPYTGYPYDLFGNARNDIGAAYMPGVVPVKGDRYIAQVTAHGWTENHIYEYNGATWDDVTPAEGMTLYNKDSSRYLLWNGSAWEYHFITIRPGEISSLLTNCTPDVMDVLMSEDVSDSYNKKKITLGDMFASIPPRQHGIADNARHTSSATSGKMLKADANGLPVDATNTDTEVSGAVSASHAKQHAITATADHTSSATSGKMLKADANGLPVDATNTDTEVSSAVSLKHAQAHDLAGSDHNADTITNLNLKLSDGDVLSTKQGEFAQFPRKNTIAGNDSFVIEDAADSTKKKYFFASDLLATSFPPTAHDLAGSLHNADTITNLNLKLSDGDVLSTKAAEINAFTNKCTPLAADITVIEDSADSNNKKKIRLDAIAQALPAMTPAAHDLAGSQHNADTITNLNLKLSDGDVISTKSGEINALTNKTTAAYADLILIEDSAASNVKKKLPVSGLLEAVRSVFLPADALMSPVTGWAVNTLAPVAPDITYPATLVRPFDDTAEEGVGAQFYIPAGATNLIIEFFGRPATAPGVAKGVVMKLYTKNMPINSAQVAWSAGTTMTTLSIPTNAYWQMWTQTIALSTLSLVADTMCMLEFTRNGADGNDTLVGDFNLAGLKLFFS